jgi:hypothetical protein
MACLAKGEGNSWPLVLESDATVYMWREISLGAAYLKVIP